MAKEQVHNYLRMIVLLAGIVFAGGGYAMKINSNSQNIEKNEDSITIVQNDVHRIELNSKDIQSLAASAAKAAARSEIIFIEIQKSNSSMRTDIGKIQTKMEFIVKE